MKDNVPASRDMPKIGASPLRVVSPGDTGQCLETYLIAMTGRVLLASSG